MIAKRPNSRTAMRATPNLRRTEPRPNAYLKIKQAILSGDLQPGQTLVEVSLAEWCQVSRTPIREALTRLEHDGLISRGERGLVVRESSPEEILDIYDTRIVLESTAGRFAAERRTSHDLVAMSRLTTRMDEMAVAPASEKVEINARFHRTIWRASHNESLTDLLERLNMHLGRYPATTLAYPGRWQTANTQHAALVQAIEDRDGDLAAAISTEHFTAARDIRLTLWETQ